MPKLFILSTLGACPLPADAIVLIDRKISSRERDILARSGIRRYYSPQMNEQQSKDFFDAFANFWDAVVEGKDQCHPFWRNGVSSKMQEWESSVGNLIVTLFSVDKDERLRNASLAVLPGGIAEARVWRAWARSAGWPVAYYGFGILASFRERIDNVLRVLYLTGRSIARKFVARGYVLVPRRRGVLFVTMYYRQALQKDRYEDLFFGSLHRRFERDGIPTLYVGDAIDGFSWKERTRPGGDCGPVSIYSLLSWGDLFFALLKTFLAAPCFKKCLFQATDMSEVLGWHARRARYEFNLTAELFYRAVRRVCIRYQPLKMMYGFEGNVYERAAVQAFREVSKGTVDAYSHAVLYPLNLKLYVSPAEKKCVPEPDRYLVCGELSLKILSGIRKTDVPLVQACSLRAMPRFGTTRPFCGDVVLVVLDGVLTAATMLDWLCEHSDVFCGRRVLVRFHPNIPVARIISQCLYYKSGIFEISQTSLEEDLRQSLCVIYRQSSVGIQAIMNGIPAVCLAVDQPLSGDPLWGAGESFSGEGHFVVHDRKELAGVLKQLEGDRGFLGDGEALARRYFSSATPGLMESFDGGVPVREGA